MSKTITNFPYHINNATEKISAQDINEIAGAINNSEKNILDVLGTTFEQKAFFTLQNNNDINSMFMDDLKTPYKVFMANSTSIQHNASESSITLINSGAVKEGVFQTTKLVSKYTTSISKFVLLVDEEIPKGCRINYFVSSDGMSFYPIKANTGVVTEVPTTGNAMFVKAQLYKNKNFESPKLFGWALLYNDPVVDKLGSLKSVDFSQIESTVMGDTVLVRDKKRQDKIVAIIGPDDLTELSYDEEHEMRLSKVTQRDDDQIIAEVLNYGPYEDSHGATNTVLLGTTRLLESGSIDEGGIL